MSTSIKEKQIEEALFRMNKLGLHENVINEFCEGKLNKSESIGILFWLTEEEEKDAREWEEETGNLIYHVIVNNTEFGICYSYLYVSKHENDWIYDREDLKELKPLVYVRVKSGSGFSEFGRIGIKSNIGGLIRVH